MKISYTKLADGSWGIKSDGVLQPGMDVEVTKRDGSVKLETVGRIVSQREGTTVAVIGSSAVAPEPQASRGRDRLRCSRCGNLLFAVTCTTEDDLDGLTCDECSFDDRFTMGMWRDE